MSRFVTSAAVVAGVAWALSPLTLWLIVATALLLGAATRGVDGPERRWVIGLVVAAVLVRVGAVAGLILWTDPGDPGFASFFGDGSYAIGRSLWLRSAWLAEPMHPRYLFEAFEEYASGGFNYVQAVVQVVVGPTTWALHLLATFTFVAGAVVCYRLVRASFGPPAAVLTFGALLFWPSWIAWSMTPIKDSLQFALAALALAGAASAFDASRPAYRRAAELGLAALAMIGLSTMRTGALVVMAGTLAAGAAWVIVARWHTLAITGAIVAALAVGVVASNAGVRGRVAAEIDAAASRHVGHTATPGTPFRLLDEHLYRWPAREPLRLTPAERARFLARAVAAFAVVPLPWHFSSRESLLYLPAHLLWGVVVACAVIGVAPALWRQPALTTMLLAHIALSAAVIAPNSGNVGTLVRHRDAVVPFVICLAAVGASLVIAARRPAGPVPAAEASCA